MEKKDTWVKKRHQRVYKFFKPIFKRLLTKKGFKYEQYDLPNRPHLIISNHLTRLDQYMMCLLFNQMLYFVARDDLFSSRLFSRFLEYTCAPIPKSKVTKDIRTIRICSRIAQEGGNIALFPEGNLSFSGELCNFYTSTAKLVKLLKLPLVIVNNVGGYGAIPRWSAKSRKGYFTMKVTQVLQPEEYSAMSVEELQSFITEKLSVDNLNTGEKYVSNRKAERLELLTYVCPNCGLTVFASKGNTLRCTKCNQTWEYTEDLKFIPPTPFVNTAQWYDYQLDYVSKLQLDETAKPLYLDNIRWIRIEVNGKYKQKVFLNPKLELYADKFTFIKGKRSITYRFDDIVSMALLGRNKLEFYVQGKKFFFQPEKHTNGLKYMQLFYSYKQRVGQQLPQED